MRFAAPSVVCPRCGNESPPTGAGRFMTCAKCGMSIDAQASERQETVRGRVKDKPEVEIDPTLPQTASKFPLGTAVFFAVLITLGVVYLIYRLKFQDVDELTVEQRENLRAVEDMQRGFRQAWSAFAGSQDSPSCDALYDIVRKPCKATVIPDKLAFDQAIQSMALADQTHDCEKAVEAFAKSRIDAKCD